MKITPPLDDDPLDDDPNPPIVLLGPPAGDEDAEQLANTLRACAVAEIDRRALLLRLTRLPPGMLRAVHRQRARIAIEPLLSADRARLFRLADGSLVALWRGTGHERIDHAMRSLKLLFADLPPGLAERAGLITLLDLPRDNAVLLDAIEESQAAILPRRSAPRVMPTEPLDIPTLAGLEQALAHADVAHFVRRKPVCSVGLDETLRLRWEKRYLSISELAETLVPDHNPAADPWLFRRLTRTLDRRMLALLAHPEELRNAGPFALNLNVSSILSPYFLRFDAALPTALRGEVLLELMPADVIADPASFVFARDFARTRGYKLLLRDITADLLGVFPLDPMGFDHLQLRWSPGLETLDAAAIADAAGDLDRVVLGRVPDKSVVEWGRKRGLTLFIGPFVQPGVRVEDITPYLLHVPPREDRPAGPDPWLAPDAPDLQPPS